MHGLFRTTPPDLDPDPAEGIAEAAEVARWREKYSAPCLIVFLDDPPYGRKGDVQPLHNISFFSRRIQEGRAVWLPLADVYEYLSSAENAITPTTPENPTIP